MVRKSKVASWNFFRVCLNSARSVDQRNGYPGGSVDGDVLGRPSWTAVGAEISDYQGLYCLSYFVVDVLSIDVSRSDKLVDLKGVDDGVPI